MNLYLSVMHAYPSPESDDCLEVIKYIGPFRSITHTYQCLRCFDVEGNEYTPKFENNLIYAAGLFWSDYFVSTSAYIDTMNDEDFYALVVHPHDAFKELL